MFDRFLSTPLSSNFSEDYFQILVLVLVWDFTVPIAISYCKILQYLFIFIITLQLRNISHTHCWFFRENTTKIFPSRNA